MAIITIAIITKDIGATETITLVSTGKADTVGTTAGIMMAKGITEYRVIETITGTEALPSAPSGSQRV
jgi:hypothetical protein